MIPFLFFVSRRDEAFSLCLRAPLFSSLFDQAPFFFPYFRFFSQPWPLLLSRSVVSFSICFVLGLTDEFTSSSSSRSHDSFSQNQKRNLCQQKNSRRRQRRRFRRRTVALSRLRLVPLLQPQQRCRRPAVRTRSLLCRFRRRLVPRPCACRLSKR